MDRIIRVNGIGHFEYSSELYTYIHNEGKVHWALGINGEGSNIDELIRKAELLIVELERFEKTAKIKLS
ncbi:hypothetical protein DNH61_03560 [Paenibacillus sambharensis]|uniref:Uncharacterized protein n=1 Tax=Paenibacillus sambharensis TaxID=1803190 RepID=A0A2W1LDR4_9BACL|nr:hypothetical protein [Paenibacillus sambharensis]PZD97226.1 hypothetical protein DNH61_03560 [Paenibacillus sambharensis]